MNNALNAEINNFPITFQDSGEQLKTMKSKIMDFHNKIKDLDLNTISESNLDGLYDLFSELYELVHMNVSEGIYHAIFRDPAIRSLLPAIHYRYSSFFNVHEAHLAREILNNDDPWRILESFPLYQRYVNLIEVQIQNSPDIETLAFIGCGPLPVTLLLFSKLYGISCIGIDKDPEAVEMAKRCVKHFDLEKDIRIIQGNETELTKIEWDSVLIAGLAEPKIRIFQNLNNITKKKKLELKKHISICYRNYTGMRQLLYRPVIPEYTGGFRKVKEIYPSGGVHNTLVFLECE